MTKEELKRLTIYADHIKSRMEAPLPAKHLHRGKEYRQYLAHELNLVTSKIESGKLDLGNGGKL
jgi:hypothetical protein